MCRGSRVTWNDLAYTTDRPCARRRTLLSHVSVLTLARVGQTHVGLAEPTVSRRYATGARHGGGGPRARRARRPDASDRRLAAAPDTRIDLYAYVTAGDYRHNGDYSTGLTHGQQQHVQVQVVQVLSRSPHGVEGYGTRPREGNRGTLGWPARDAL